MAEQTTVEPSRAYEAPHPGSKRVPRWNVGDLIDAPKFTGRNWWAMLGPGLLMGGAAIGGGEWLTGPAVTARYGGALLWLATLSILGQVLYNVEISRYTLYTGEPIFTGKFRTLPGPMFWPFVYLVLDFGAVFPYLAANAATPIAAMWLGEVPNPEQVPEHRIVLRVLGYAIFLLALMPLVFGGKIYDALKAIMSFKIVVVLGFLLLLGIFFSGPSTWMDIFSGFAKFGTVPIQQAEDVNGNGQLDPGEDWDGDNRLDLVEPTVKPTIDTDGDGRLDAGDLNGDGTPEAFVEIGRTEETVWWPDVNRDDEPDQSIAIDLDGDGEADQVDVASDHDGHPFLDFDGDGKRDGDNLDNIFLSLLSGRGFPDVDLSMIALVAAMVAIAGSGGLSNTPVSNYTRDQGWGMGWHVGAIPSVVGGRHLKLSHVGTVFQPTGESLPRWRRWYRHVLRDQLVIWMPACFFGLALPSMLSVEFLPRGAFHSDWTTAAMTADGVRDHVGGALGPPFWYMTLFCGFLVLAPSMASSADGLIRRWVDAFWTASPRLRRLDPRSIRYVYFGVLIVYALFGLTMLTLGRPLGLLKIATSIFNFALGFSCWHTLAINMTLLPRELRPGWFVRITLVLAGVFFWTMATLSALRALGWI